MSRYVIWVQDQQREQLTLKFDEVRKDIEKLYEELKDPKFGENVFREREKLDDTLRDFIDALYRQLLR